jgi:RNA polymerase sigma-70 factor, ECF subfamily
MERDLEGLRGETVASRQESSPAMTFEAHRPLLFSVAYRMLGSRADAEDMLQEAFLRWHQIDTREVRSARAFLVTIITRLCINYMQSAQVRREQYVGPWLPEPLITDSGSDLLGTPALDGSLSIAFLFLLERLSPTERAVFLLREVFDYEYSEIAEALNQNVANCRQILRRAKQRIAEGKARFNTTTQQREQVLQQFVQTSSDGNIEGLLALLSEDVVLYADGGGKVTAVPNPIYGAANVVRFLVGARKKFLSPAVVRRRTYINGQAGIVTYDGEELFGVLSLDMDDGKIVGIYIVRNPDKLCAMSAGRQRTPDATLGGVSSQRRLHL